MKTRITITVIWLSSLLIAIGLIEAYFLRVTGDGIPFLLPHERAQIYKVLAAIYASNIAPIIVVWFLKPLPKPQHAKRTRFIGVLAISLTTAYNLLLLYLLAQDHFAQTQPIESILQQIKAIMGTLAFLVVPVNTYYFGIKSKSLKEGG